MTESRDPKPSTLSGVFETILTAIGVPVLACVIGANWQALRDYAQRHPWQALGLLLLYEIAVFIGRFISEVWSKLRAPLIDFFVNWLKRATESRISGFEGDYRKHVFYHCRDFDVKGLSTQGIYSLEMKRVFVELSVVPHQADKHGHDPIPAQAETIVPSDRHNIWEYIATPGHFAIIGAPGSGKTTLLKHIAITLAFSRRKEASQTLPVLLYLRSHAKAIAENADLPLHEAILASEVVKEQTIKAPSGWFEDALKGGRCMILFDGLDEVGHSEMRMKVVAWVEKQIHAHANNRFFITSRPLGYHENPVPGVTTLRVLPLAQDQIDRFVSNWYLANEVMSHNKEDEGVRVEARKGAAELMTRIRSSDVLSDLAVNPLLLTMIATVHRYRSQLPGRRVELYREICEVFLGKRQAVKGIQDDLTPDQKRFVLESLAFDLMRTKKRDIPAAEAAVTIAPALKLVKPDMLPADFLRMVENSSGLLLEREQGVYSFAHKTFQEYLAAVHIRSNRLEQELVAKIEDRWWHETIRLYVAESDATPVLEACLSHHPPTIEALTLAVECILEAQRVDEKWREKIEQMLTDSDHEHQRIYGEAMLVIRRRNMVSINETGAIDPTFVTNAEYQVFQAQMLAEGKQYAPDHWPESRFAKGDGSRPVALARFSHAQDFCQWMTAKYGGTSWKYTIPSADQLQTVPVADPRQQDIQDQIGCWSAEGRLLGGGQSLAKLRIASERFLRSLTKALAGAASVKALDLLSELILVRARSTQLAEACDVDDNVVYSTALWDAWKVARELAEQLRQHLISARRLHEHANGVLVLALAVGRDPADDLAHAHTLAVNIHDSLERALHFTDELLEELAGTQHLARAINKVRDLEVALKRAFGDVIDLSGVLGAGGELARGPNVTRAANFARDRVRSLGDGLATDLKMDPALAIANLYAYPSDACIYDLKLMNSLLALKTAQVVSLDTFPNIARALLVNEMRKGAALGGVRPARVRVSGAARATAAASG